MKQQILDRIKTWDELDELQKAYAIVRQEEEIIQVMIDYEPYLIEPSIRINIGHILSKNKTIQSPQAQTIIKEAIAKVSSDKRTKNRVPLVYLSMRVTKFEDPEQPGVEITIVDPINKIAVSLCEQALYFSGDFRPEPVFPTGALAPEEKQIKPVETGGEDNGSKSC